MGLEIPCKRVGLSQFSIRRVVLVEAKVQWSRKGVVQNGSGRKQALQCDSRKEQAQESGP